MTRKKWTGGEPVLSVETEDEFHQALPLGLPVEVTPAIAEGIGLMAEDVSTLEEIIAAQERRLYAPANAKRPDRRVLGEMAASPARHCHVNRVGPPRSAWIPFQAAALELFPTLNASSRNRLNVNLLHQC